MPLVPKYRVLAYFILIWMILYNTYLATMLSALLRLLHILKCTSDLIFPWKQIISISNKKILVFRVTQPYLNLLVKPRIVFMFSGKNIILCILKGILPCFERHFAFQNA